MALNDRRKQEMLAYCRIDESELSEAEKLLIETLCDAAVGYMAGAGITEPEENGLAAQYWLCVNALVLESWERRDMTEPAVMTENPALRRIINQLKLIAGNGNTDAG